jgi:hypothetical protein
LGTPQAADYLLKLLPAAPLARQILDMHGPFATEAEAVANVRLVLPNIIEEPPSGDKLQ